MEIAWGVVLILLGGVAWLGQLICALSPALGVKWGLTESAADTESALYIEGRGEAIWDALTIWTLPLCGLLLVIGHPYWVYVGLIAGGSYFYFSGRVIVTRVVLQRKKLSIGSKRSILIAYVFSLLWVMAALITIGMALQGLI